MVHSCQSRRWGGGVGVTRRVFLHKKRFQMKYCQVCKELLIISLKDTKGVFFDRQCFFYFIHVLCENVFTSLFAICLLCLQIKRFIHDLKTRWTTIGFADDVDTDIVIVFFEGISRRVISISPYFSSYAIQAQICQAWQRCFSKYLLAKCPQHQSFIPYNHPESLQG